MRRALYLMLQRLLQSLIKGCLLQVAVGIHFRSVLVIEDLRWRGDEVGGPGQLRAGRGLGSWHRDRRILHITNHF